MNKTLYLGLIISCIVAVFQTACNSTKPTPRPPSETEQIVIKDRIMTLLPPRIKGSHIENAFSDYEVKSQGMTSRTENRWIFTYNTELIKPEEMLQKFKESEMVLEAEFAPQN